MYSVRPQCCSVHVDEQEDMMDERLLSSLLRTLRPATGREYRRLLLSRNPLTEASVNFSLSWHREHVVSTQGQR